MDLSVLVARSLVRALRENRLNFLIGRRDVLGVRVDGKKRLWTGYSKIAGTLRLQMRDHSQREWIIVGNQDADAIAASLGFPRANQTVQRTGGSRSAEGEMGKSSAAASRR